MTPLRGPAIQRDDRMSGLPSTPVKAMTAAVSVAPSPGMRELDGQVALVPGGSRGIGRAVAKALAEGGAKIAVVSRDGVRADQAAEELPGEGHRGFACDVSDSGPAAQTLKAAEELVGEVSILVNNAGITRDNILLRMKNEEWDEVMLVNIKGAVSYTHLTLPTILRV